MRRFLLLLLVLGFSLDAEAQRILGKRKPRGQVVPVSISLTTPTPSPDYETTATEHSPCGVARAGVGIVRVTWTSDAPGVGPGTATGATVGTSYNWCVTAESVLTVAQDNVGTGTDVLLSTTTPTIGTAWACPVNTTGDANPILAYATGVIGPTGSDASGAHRIICLITPVTPLVGTNYDLEIKLPASMGGATDGLALIFGYADTDDYCALTIFGADAAEDLVMSKTVTGTASVIGTPANANVLPGQLVRVKVRGSTLTAEVEDVEKIATTSTDCDNAAGVGIGVGSFRGQSGTTTHVFDTFTEGSNTALASHTSDTGGAKTEVIDTTGTLAMEVAASSDRLRATASIGNAGVLYTFAPATALPSANYTAALTFNNTSGAVAPVCFGGRYIDTMNYVGLCLYGSSANPDVQLIEIVAGVLNVIDTADCAVATGHVYEITYTGSTASAQRAGSACLLEGTTAILTTGLPWIGMGNISGVATDDTNVNTLVDNFTVTAGSGGDTISILSQVDSVTLIDQDATADGIPLAAGLQTLTFTALATDATTAVITQRVTREVLDTVDPSVVITAPVSGATHTTSSAAANLAGGATDNIGVDAVEGACPTCTPTTFTATYAAGAWFYNNLGLAEGLNVITMTAEDAAGNTATDIITIDYDPGDTEDPTIQINSPNGGSDVTTTTAAFTVSGVAGDNNPLPAGAVTFVCTNATPTAGTATGTNGWSFSGTLALGTGKCTVTVKDVDLNEAMDDIDFTYSVPLVIGTTTLSGATQSSAYSRQVLASGGTTPYTFDNNAGGSSLGAGACTGLSITTSAGQGLVSGTPTTVGTCNFTAKVTDNVAATDTQALSIVVSAAGSAGAHDYFNTLVAHPNKVTDVSFRKTTAPTHCVTYVKAGAGLDPNEVACDAEGIHFTVPQWSTVHTGTGFTEHAYAASTPGTHEVLPFPLFTSVWSNGRGVRVGTEVMILQTTASSLPNRNIASCTAANPSVCTTTAAASYITGDRVRINNTSLPALNGTFHVLTKLPGSNTQFQIQADLSGGGSTGGSFTIAPDAGHIHVIRGSYGTPAPAHSIGEELRLSINSINGSSQAWVATQSLDGHTKVYTWEAQFGPELLKTSMGNFKLLNLRRAHNDAITLEPNLNQEEDEFCNPTLSGTTFNPDVHIGALGPTRFYNTPGPGVTNITPVEPMLATLCVVPNKWYRTWIIWEQRAGTPNFATGDGYEKYTMMISSENEGPITVMSEAYLVTAAEAQTGFKWWTIETNTSTDSVTRAEPGIAPANWRNYYLDFRDYVELDFVTTPTTTSDFISNYINGVRPIR